MDIKEKLELLEETMYMEEGTLKPEMVLKDIEEYTSIIKLSLIVMMDDEFDKLLDRETLMGFETVQDILDYMG